MKIVAAVLRIVRIYALTLWVGGLVFFIVVAAVAFGSLPSSHEAGLVVRGCLLALHNIGLVCGFLYLFATLPLRLLGERNKANAIGQVLVLIMLGLTFYSRNSIIPRMETDRLALGGEVTQDNASAPSIKTSTACTMSQPR